MLTADQLPQFAESGPVVVTPWTPAADHYGKSTPVVLVAVDGDILTWWPCFVSTPVSARMRKLVALPDGIRVDLAMTPDESLIFRRPANDAEYEQGAQWITANKELLVDAQVIMRTNAEAVRRSLAPQKRDKLIPISYWESHDFRLNRMVPAGIVVPNEPQKTLTWVPLSGWEAAADERNGSIGTGIDDPIEVMGELAERGNQNNSISYPEYIRASSIEDAINIGLSTQRHNLMRVLSKEPTTW